MSCVYIFLAIPCLKTPEQRFESSKCSLFASPGNGTIMRFLSLSKMNGFSRQGRTPFLERMGGRNARLLLSVDVRHMLYFYDLYERFAELLAQAILAQACIAATRAPGYAMHCTVLRVRAVLRGILFDDFHEDRVEENYKTIVGQAGLQGTCFCITGPVTPIDNRPGFFGR